MHALLKMGVKIGLRERKIGEPGSTTHRSIFTDVFLIHIFVKYVSPRWRELSMGRSGALGPPTNQDDKKICA
jgi:hypothetical protein